jgi:hypothetical protein
MAITTTRYAIFNSFNLNSIPGLSVYAITPPGSAQRTLNIFQSARSSARKVNSAFYQANKIRVGIYITANTRAALEAAMDTLFANLQAQEASLVVPMSGGTARQYTCTLSDNVINNTMSNTDSPAGNYVDMTLVFECSDSFGYDQFFTTLFNTGNLTSSPNTWPYTQGGGADVQVPVLSFYFTGGALGTGTVTIGNQNTGQSIQITRTWSVGETLVVNAQLNTVQVNGVDVVFSGAIPTFGLGAQTITYQDTFASRTYQLYATVNNRWN